MFKYLFKERKRYRSYIALINEDPIKELNTLGFLESWGIRYMESPYDGITLVPFESFLRQTILSRDIVKLNSQFLSINPILGEYVVDNELGKDVFIGDLLYNEIVPSTYREDTREYSFTIGGGRLDLVVLEEEDNIQIVPSGGRKPIEWLPISERRQLLEGNLEDLYNITGDLGNREIILEESRLFGPTINKILGTRI